MVAQTTAASSPPAPWSGAGRIAGPDDVARVLAAVNAAGGRRANTAALLRPVTAVDDLAERAGGAAGYLPVHPLLAPLLPWSGGLRRGATVAATGGMSLLLALLAGAMSTGGCARVVGLPSLGAVAAAEQGVPLQRLALAPHPGPDWPAVAAALLDGLDLLVVPAPTGAVDATVWRMLAARARSRGAVLVSTRTWVGCDLTLTVTRHDWAGLGTGRGRLRGHQMTVRATGRGVAFRPREVTVPVPLAGRDRLPAGERPISGVAGEVAGRAALSA
jgi:hypothetical protein